MTDTVHLGMPFIEGSQAQKHVTHNEALRILDAAVQIGVLDIDRTAPPASPAEGDRHIVASGATGAWAGHVDAVAVYEDGAWRFLIPKLGWCAWSDADGALLVYDGAAWTDVASGGTLPGSVAQLGINDTASALNLLTVKSNAALFSAIDVADSGTGDVRLQISKEASANTASVVFSDAFSARAEFGLIGSDTFKLKVSNDGSAFVEALVIDQSSGNAALPRGLSLTGVISPSQITSNQNDYNPTGIASASVLNLSSDALRSMSGLAGGAEGRVIALINTGSQVISLLNESTSSAAANRFALGCEMTIAGKQAALLRYDGIASRWRAISRPGGRELLTASRTYYVRTDGSDSNDGLANTSDGAFLTRQKAIDTVAALDLSIYNVTIQIGNGTYTGSLTVSGPWIGSGTVTVQGNNATPASVLISTTSADAFKVQGGGRLIVKDVKIQTTTSGYGVLATGLSSVSFQNVDFGACASAHVRADNGSAVTATGNYAISAGAPNHWAVAGGGQIVVQSVTVTLSGTPAFTTFAQASSLSQLRVNANTFSGSATGAYYTVSGNSVISVGGAGGTYLPGNAAAGTPTATGGQYF
jgi:hypothetical protein